MALIPTQGNQILVDAPSSVAKKAERAQVPGQALVTWLVGKAEPWEQHRNQGYQTRWGQYWRLWRGQWSEEDKNRMSERSRLVAPALSQAIEMTVSELEEAVFSKDVWFDVEDDLADNEKLDALLARDNLLEDLDKVNASDAIGEAILNGAIFGTGILKLNVEVVKEATPERDTETNALRQKTDEVVRVNWEAIRPDEFIPDPTGRTIQEMLGCFHCVKKPVHAVLEKIESGLYRDDAAPFISGGYQSPNFGEIDPNDPQANLSSDEGEQAEILEYHGKVPLSLLNAAKSGGADINPLDAILAEDDEQMVEAIVTIANRGTLLRAMVNPFTMRDRSIIAFQFEKVPGRFWGRGVAEKGFNPQKALDSEIRARIDALAYLSAPMIAVDGGRVPRGFKLEVKPGKVWLTQGPPDDVLKPIQIGAVEPNTFNQASEMERMVQMGTGAFDTATSLRSQGGQANGPSPSNVSLMMGAFVKRAKRAIRNVNNNLVEPAIKKTLWRYMQFAPRRYPEDYNFRVMATLGIVAREVEAMQLTQLMGMMPEQYPQVSAVVAKGIIDLGSLHNKAEIIQAIDAATAPPSKEQQQRNQKLQDLQDTAVAAEAQGKLLANQKTIAETRALMAKAMADLAKAQAAGQTDPTEAALELQRLRVELEQLDVAREQTRVDLAKAYIGLQTAKAQARASNQQ